MMMNGHSSNSSPEETLTLPLTLMLQLDQRHVERTNRLLLIPAIEAAMRGLLTSSISTQFAGLVTYWRDVIKENMTSNSIDLSWDRTLLTVEEAFEPLLESLNVYVEYLRDYGKIDNLTVDVLGLNAIDGSVIVRISDGRDNSHNPWRRDLQEFPKRSVPGHGSFVRH